MSKTKEQKGSATDLSEFESTMKELEAFSKANTGTMAKAGSDDYSASAMDDDRDEDEDDEMYEKRMKRKKGYDDGMAEPMGKSVQSDGDGGNDYEGEHAMDADDFLKKSHDMFATTLKHSSQHQNQAVGLMAQGMVAQGKMLKSLMEEVVSMRGELVNQGSLPKMRKSTLTIQDHESSGQQQVASGETDIPRLLLAKAHGPQGLVAQGKLTPSTIGIVERCSNRGEALPPSLEHLAQYAVAN